MRWHRRWLMTGLALLLGLIVWTLVRTPDDTGAQGEREVATRAVPTDAAVREVARRESVVEQAPKHTDKTQEQEQARRRARRDALHRGILDALDQRRSTVHRPRGDRIRDDAEDGQRVGELRDRIGGRDALLEALNADFMPLADECIGHARQRAPELAGMLALEIDVISDPDLGAVIDTVEFPGSNEVSDLELLECVRQTALSTELPPPPEGGHDEFKLTIPIEPQGAASPD